jgi:hypothetical protein
MPLARNIVPVRVHLAIVLLLAAGCGKSAEECRTEAEALGKLLKETPHRMSPFGEHRGLTLVKRTDLTASAGADGFVVAASPDSVIFEYRALAGTAELLQRLLDARERRSWRDLRRVYLQLDRATPWSKVVELVDIARSVGLTSVGFAFDNGEKLLTRPPRSPVDDKLDAILAGDPTTRATELAKLVETMIDDCPALQQEFGSVGSESAEDKADVLIRGLVPALIECNCKVDMPGFRSAMWRLIAIEPNVKVLAFELAGDKLALPARTTWEDASKHLIPGKSYQLAVQ